MQVYLHLLKYKTCRALSEIWILALIPLIMSKPVCSMEDHQQQRKHITSSFDWSKFSEISLHKQKQTLDKCRLLTNSVYDGLDLRHKILTVNNQNLGHTKYYFIVTRRRTTRT